MAEITRSQLTAMAAVQKEYMVCQQRIGALEQQLSDKALLLESMDGAMDAVAAVNTELTQELIDRTTHTDTHIAENERRIAELEGRDGQMQVSIAALTQELAQAAVDVFAAQDQLATVEQARDALKQYNDELELALRDFDQRLYDEQRGVIKLGDELAALEQERDALKCILAVRGDEEELKADLATLRTAVRNVLVDLRYDSEYKCDSTKDDHIHTLTALLPKEATDDTV